MKLAGTTGAFALVGSTLLEQAAKASCSFTPATVVVTKVVSSNASAADQTALLNAITGSWQRYLAMDAVGYKSFLSSDMTKMSGRWGAGGLLQGADAVAAALPMEWTAYEHPAGVVAERFNLKQVELWVDPGGQSATALYWVGVLGGARWCYSDQGLVFQAFTRVAGTWKLAHQIDSWNSNYNLAKMAPGPETFPFEYVTPVTDLNRAVAFYSKVCGQPEYVGAGRAQFQLKGARFVLDSTRLGGLAPITKGLPNSWAVFLVDDVVAERAKLAAAGCKFLAGTGATLLNQGPDKYAVALDIPSQNPFVIMQRDFVTNGAAPSGPAGLGATDAATTAAKKIATAWLHEDGPGMQSLYGNTGRLFDDTRTHVRGLEKGSALASTLASAYWNKYDRSSQGLSADLAASSVRVRSLGTHSLVSFQQSLSSSGVHPFRDPAYVTHVLDQNGKPLVSMTVSAEEHDALALSLDYSGYPVSDLLAAESFYNGPMALGKPYPDSGYRGWWSDNGVVFGIYIAKPSRDHLPRPNIPSGYMSFWVPSAQEAYNWLKSQNSTFVLIPAINSRRGIDPEPGYTQVTATDSEGNVQVFTEYTGQ